MYEFVPYVLAATAVVAVICSVPMISDVWSAWQRYRGRRLVTCPETRAPAALDLDVRRAVQAAVHGDRDVQPADCSRWRERPPCAGPCIGQVERDPDGTRVAAVARRWFAGKACVHCGTPVHPEDRIDQLLAHGPAILKADGAPVAWTDLPAESLPRILSESLPLCWSCYEAETFRRQFPDLITERGFKPVVSRLQH
jgi:hypothetical protein